MFVLFDEEVAYIISMINVTLFAKTNIISITRVE